MYLSESVQYPIKYHVNITGYSFPDVVIHKIYACHTVCEKWCGILLVSHLCESYACALLTLVGS